jgi:glycine oxidase
VPSTSRAESTTAGPKVAIIGAGIIGLSIGWRLAQSGCPVSIYERDEPGRGASWAAAGMLAAGSEAEPTESGLFALGRFSQSLWPGFAAELEAAAEMTIGHDRTGTLHCAFTRDQAAQLDRMARYQSTLGGVFERLSGREARALEPSLAPGVVGAMLSREDHQVDNRLVVQALERAYRRAGGTLCCGSEAALALNGGAVEGVIWAGRLEPADRVVLAAGPWSREISGLPPEAQPPVRPVKGQMLALAMPAERPLIRHVVRGSLCYLVPRRDGRLLIGATVEERGFDAAVTAGGVLSLLDDAWRTLPGVEELPIQEMWTGFRPGSPDDMPILGLCPVDRLVLATGHHRNGILLTPATAQLIAELCLSGRVDERLSPFALARFAGGTE